MLTRKWTSRQENGQEVKKDVDKKVDKEVDNEATQVFSPKTFFLQF